MEKHKEYSKLESKFDELWPLLRSITGPGLRKSLNIFKKDMPLDIEGVETGKSIFDWQIPPEWRIREARLTGPNGETYADLDDTNLSVVNYSEPVDKYLTRDELEAHLYSLPELPDAIPYVTSYYERNWGFCLPHNLYERLPEGEYHAYIDSEFVDGELNYGHAILEGETDREVLLSANICHPSLANNELSGPLVLTSLAHVQKLCKGGAGLITCATPFRLIIQCRYGLSSCRSCRPRSEPHLAPTAFPSGGPSVSAL